MDNIEKIIEIIKEELGSELDPDITITPEISIWRQTFTSTHSTRF